jgi:hypothetical protein
MVEIKVPSKQTTWKLGVDVAAEVHIQTHQTNDCNANLKSQDKSKIQKIGAKFLIKIMNESNWKHGSHQKMHYR